MSNNNAGQSFSAKIAKGSAVLSAGEIILKFTGLGSTLLILYILNLYEYGLYKLIFAAFGFLSAFLFAGIDKIVMADMIADWGQGKIGKVKRLFAEFLGVKMTLAVLLWIVSFFGAGIVEKFYGGEIAFFLRALSFLFLILPLKGAMSFVFNMNLKFVYLSISTVIEDIMKLLFILFFHFIFQMSINGIILAYVLSAFAVFLILLPVALRLARPIFGAQADKEYVLPDIIKNHGKWGILNVYVTSVQRNLQPWLIKFFIGTEAVAVVSVARTLIGHIGSLFPLFNVLIPAVPREIRDKERLKRIFFRGVKYSTPIFAAMALFAFFTVPYFIKFVFPRYEPSLPPFNILLFMMLFFGASNVFISFFYALKMQKELFLINFSGTIFMLIAAAGLMPALGITGAVLQILILFALPVPMSYYFIVCKMPELAFNFSEFFKIDSYDREALKRLAAFIKSKLNLA